MSFSDNKPIVPCILFILIMLIRSEELSGQGCSDAGVCSMDAFSIGTMPEDEKNEIMHSIGAGISIGLADNDIFVLGNQFRYSVAFSRNISFDLQLTSLLQSGNSLSQWGLGDALISGSFISDEAIQFSLGIKVPLHRANRVSDGLPLPMDYQSSLGSTDIIAGISYHSHNFFFALAIQQPILQNQNSFEPEVHPAESPLREFIPTAGFRRAGDVMFRFGYQFAMSKYVILSPSILPIYHLANDTFLTSDGQRATISGSQGLTLNLAAKADIQVSSKNNLILTVGFPVLVRKQRPDGLTRAFVLGGEYTFAW